MSAVTHVEWVIGRTRHITNPDLRQRVQTGLDIFVKQIEKIEDSDDDSYYSHNERDGVPVVSQSDLAIKEQERIDHLRAMNQGVGFVGFDDELIDEGESSQTEPAIDQRHAYGRTRLMQAVVDRDIQTVKNCLALSANRYITDNGGNTPADKARKLGYDDIVELLQN